MAAAAPAGNTPTAPGSAFRDVNGNAIVVNPIQVFEELNGGVGAGGPGGGGAVNRIIVNNVVAGGGMMVPDLNAGIIKFQGGLIPGANVQRRQRNRPRLHPGRGRRGNFGVKLGPFKGGTQQLVGFGDDNNGIFFGQGNPADPSNTKPYIITRSDTSTVPVDTVIHSDNWNLDKLDGAGPSGHTFDPENKYQVIIDYNWCGGSAPRVGIQWLNPSAAGAAAGGSTPIWVHALSYTGTPGNEYIRTPDLPINFENKTFLPVSAPQEMEMLCVNVVDYGGTPGLFGQPRSASREGNERKVGANDLQQVIAIQAQSPYATVPWTPKKAQVTAVDNSGTAFAGQVAFEWYVYVNPDVNGPVAFNPVQDSSLQSDIGGEQVTFTPTTYLHSSGTGNGTATIDLSDLSDWSPGVDEFGTPDRLVIAVRPLKNDALFFGTINWQEP